MITSATLLLPCCGRLLEVAADCSSSFGNFEGLGASVDDFAGDSADDFVDDCSMDNCKGDLGVRGGVTVTPVLSVSFLWCAAPVWALAVVATAAFVQIGQCMQA